MAVVLAGRRTQQGEPKRLIVGLVPSVLAIAQNGDATNALR